MAGLGDTVKSIHVWFPVANAGYLAQSFGKVATIGNRRQRTGTPDATATHATRGPGVVDRQGGVISGVLVRQRDIV